MKKKLIIAVNSNWNIYNYRTDLIHKLSYKFKIYILSPKDNFLKKISNKIDFIHLPVVLRPKSLNPFMNLISFIHFFIQINLIRPNVFISYTVKPNIFGVLSLLFLNTKIIINITGLGSIFLNKKLNFYKKLILLIYKSLNFKISFITVQNKFDYRFFSILKIFDKKKIILIPGSGVNTLHFHSDRTVANNDILNVLFMSRLTEEKGIHLFLKAIDIINIKLEDKFNFIIAGNYDSNAVHIKQLIQNYTSKYNNLSFFAHSDPKALIENSDIFVLPSLREGASRSLLEAMSMRRLVIGSSKPGIKNLIQDKYNGFLMHEYSEKSIVNILLNILKMNNDEIFFLTENARLFVKKNYTIQKVNNMLLDIILRK